jgi:hypothetical protein
MKNGTPASTTQQLRQSSACEQTFDSVFGHLDTLKFLPPGISR